MNILGIVGALFAVGAMSVLSLQSTYFWNQREYFQSFKKEWLDITLLSAIVSLFAGALAIRNYPLNFTQGEGVPFYIIIPFMVLVFALVFSAWTDGWSGHAPSELAWYGFWLSAPFFVMSLFLGVSQFGLINFAVWMIIFFFMFFSRGIGDADIRLMWLIGVTTVWWVGMYWSIILFGVAAVIQLIVHGLAQKFDWGIKKPVKYKKYELNFRKFLAKFNKKIDLEKTERMRQHVQFIPTIAFVWIVGLLVLIIGFPQELLIYNLFKVI